MRESHNFDDRDSLGSIQQFQIGCFPVRQQRSMSNNCDCADYRKCSCYLLCPHECTQNPARLILAMSFTPNKERRVSFSTDPPTTHVFSTDAEKEVIWWQPDDFEEFRVSIKDVVKDTKKNKNVLVGISGVYKFAEMAASNLTDEDKLGKALHKVKVDPLLTLWCTGSSGRGLESLLRKKFTKRTSSMARASYMALVITWQGVVGEDDLRKKCMTISRQDRILARMMGEADAIAVIESHNVDKLSIDKTKTPPPARLLGRLQRPVVKRMWIPQTA